MLSAVGLGAVLLASHDLFLAIKYAGAGYLIYLGVTTVLGRGFALPPTPARIDPSATGVRLLARGFLPQAANPKAVLGSYETFAGRLAGLARQPRYATVTNRVSGGLSVAAGAGLALAGDG